MTFAYGDDGLDADKLEVVSCRQLKVDAQAPPTNLEPEERGGLPCGEGHAQVRHAPRGQPQAEGAQRQDAAAFQHGEDGR